MINIFTDPHLNVSRKAHTTQESSKRLNEALFNQVMECKSSSLPNYCAGDLFDKAFNPEWAVIQGIAVARDCYVLAGNHDETNREGTKCSLEVVEAAGVGEIIRNPKVDGVRWSKTQHNVYMIPHHASQEAFVEALREAAADSQGKGTAMVHCNRGDIMGDTPDSILVISKELEEELLQSFKRIFYGHEHGSHSNKVDGAEVTSRAVVLGNTHPTSFSDISDKFRYAYDTQTDSLQRVMIWSKEKHYAELTLGDELPDKPLQFILVKGNGCRSEAMEYLNRIWGTYPNLYAVRPEIQYGEDTVVAPTQTDVVSLPEAISKDLEGTKMQKLFTELMKEI
jgi:DNA repair exonuclease SbcCD nuclease subunit